MKRMLINATQTEEVRVALVDGQRLYDLDIENKGREQKKASIYKAKITRVEPSLEAAFVDFGSERHGFLPLKEISRSYFKKNVSDIGGKLNIRELVQEGQEIIVQVDKEERGTKGAALSTFISLAGRYMVLMPNNPRAGGISRRIEGEDRELLRESLSKLELPSGMGVIIRTAGIGRGPEELQWDLDYLLQLWDAILRASEEEKAPKLLYQESNVILRAIRDYLRKDIGEVLIDSPDAYAEAEQFVNQVMPHYKDRIKLYDDTIPLFSRYQIESQIETAFDHEVRLPSGGSLVIDPTEALVSIDINSARATKGADIEETAFNTNLEAAEEIARQLRLRDMGGLIVIDFIDMTTSKNQRSVENRMRDALESDRARVQVGRISRFGLMEMSRQRLRPSLEEITTRICPRCSGQGRIREAQSLALTILRVMEEEALKERSSIVRCLVPMKIASYLLNEKRSDVAAIEARTKTHMVIVPVTQMETPQYEVQRIRDDVAAEEGDILSYELVDTLSTEPELSTTTPAPVKTEEASVKGVRASSPPDLAQKHPAAAARSQGQKVTENRPGLFKRLVDLLFSAPEPEVKETTTRVKNQQQSEAGKSRTSNRRNSGTTNRKQQNRSNRTDRQSDSSQGSSPRGRGNQNRGRSAERTARNEQERGGRNRNNPQREPREKTERSRSSQKSGQARTQNSESSASDQEKQTRSQRATKSSQRTQAGVPARDDRQPKNLDQSRRKPRRDRTASAAPATKEIPSHSGKQEEVSIAQLMVAEDTPETPPRVAEVAEPAATAATPAAELSSPASQHEKEPKPESTTSDATQEAAPADTSERASNDPREMKRRQREQELRQQGVLQGTPASGKSETTSTLATANDSVGAESD